MMDMPSGSSPIAVMREIASQHFSDNPEHEGSSANKAVAAMMDLFFWVTQRPKGDPIVYQDSQWPFRDSGYQEEPPPADFPINDKRDAIFSRR